MNPCYNLVDVGRDHAHYGNIYPFRDKPDFPVRVLFYPLPLSTPNVPNPNPFVLRNWDIIEQLPVPNIGTKYDPKEYYFGPLPINQPGTPCGTADEWENGLLYSTWIAGGYSCACPGNIMPSYVSSVRCDDDSLVVSPATDNAELHINLTHTNDWLAHQTITTDAAATVNLDLKGVASQTADWLTVHDSAGGLFARMGYPITAGESAFLQMRNAAGDGYGFIGSDGLSIRNAGTGKSFDLTFGTQTIFTIFGGLWIKTSGAGTLGGRWTVGLDGDTTFGGFPGAQLFVTCKNDLTALAIEVWGDTGSGPTDVLKVDSAGKMALWGELIVGSMTFGGTALVEIVTVETLVGLLIAGKPGDTQTAPWLAINDNSGSGVFNIGPAGEIETNQTAAGTTLGSVVAYFPIYDEGGTLVGYVPIYDSIT